MIAPTTITSLACFFCLPTLAIHRCSATELVASSARASARRARSLGLRASAFRSGRCARMTVCPMRSSIAIPSSASFREKVGSSRLTAPVLVPELDERGVVGDDVGAGEEPADFVRFSGYGRAYPQNRQAPAAS
jgi:hypothetical protein